MTYCSINFISFLHTRINFNSRLCFKYSYFSNFTVNYLYLFSSCVYLFWFLLLSASLFNIHALCFVVIRKSTLFLCLSYTNRFVDKTIKVTRVGRFFN